MGVFTFTESANDFKVLTTERGARFLQAAAPTPGNETYPEEMALRLGNQAVIFFTVIILLVALLLSVSRAPTFYFNNSFILLRLIGGNLGKTYLYSIFNHLHLFNCV